MKFKFPHLYNSYWFNSQTRYLNIFKQIAFYDCKGEVLYTRYLFSLNNIPEIPGYDLSLSLKQQGIN